MKTPAGTRVECCGEPWIGEYVRRLRELMATYRRTGAGRVFWLTLPLPRGAPKTEVITAVNSAIVRAGQGMKRVTVLRMDSIFTPNGFAEVIRYRGRYIQQWIVCLTPCCGVWSACRPWCTAGHDAGGTTDV